MNEKNFRIFYGKYIRKQRSMQNLLQEEVAHKMGISVDALSRIERGLNSPSFNSSLLLEKLLQLDHQYILQEFENYYVDPDEPYED
ncbi:helix-turn-helix domain-containing protein [Paraliobacillus ryukyuensis]|uniref:helix-turn-helix domain-containing protein n=1 Tax=Paraliobacillus ryukyuensis TaxID=200904 RepID=UPI0009A6E990|nr:helix-turn-helix transcriptional regulator [Paraliobacillus ryukyuensis]